MIFAWFRKRRFNKIKQNPFPDSWREIIKQNVPYVQYLTPEEQKELEGHVLAFLSEKQFEGMEGLEITDEIKVTIAAQACVLLLHRDTLYYPTLRIIYVYPYHYFAKTQHRLPDGTVEETVEARAGESWHRGEMVLSWNDTKRGAADACDGRNVVFHEFAHQLDSEDGTIDGAPAMPRHSMYLPWGRVLTKEYLKLVKDLEHHRKTFIDAYGATSPPEFFAVVTEAFFEQPVQLKKRHPELYEQLMLFYQQDTASRCAGKKK